MQTALVKVDMVRRWFSKMVISCVLSSSPATKAGMVYKEKRGAEMS